MSRASPEEPQRPRSFHVDRLVSAVTERGLWDVDLQGEEHTWLLQCDEVLRRATSSASKSHTVVSSGGQTEIETYVLVRAARELVAEAARSAAPLPEIGNHIVGYEAPARRAPAEARWKYAAEAAGLTNHSSGRYFKSVYKHQFMRNTAEELFFLLSPAEEKS